MLCTMAPRSSAAALLVLALLGATFCSAQARKMVDQEPVIAGAWAAQHAWDGRRAAGCDVQAVGAEQRLAAGQQAQRRAWASVALHS